MLVYLKRLVAVRKINAPELWIISLLWASADFKDTTYDPITAS